MVLLNLLLAFVFGLLNLRTSGGTPDGQEGDKDKDKGEGSGTATETPPASGAQNSGTRTFTQDELNAILKDRLDRERGKYSDYDDLKAKAEKWSKLEETQKSDLDKANERAEKAEAKAQADLARANQRLVKAAIISEAANRKVRGEVMDMLVAALVGNSEIKVNDDGEVEGVDKVLEAYLKGKDFLLVKETPGKSGAEFNGKDQATIDEQIREAESKGDWRLSNRLKLQKARSQ